MFVSTWFCVHFCNWDFLLDRSNDLSFKLGCCFQNKYWIGWDSRTIDSGQSAGNTRTHGHTIVRLCRVCAGQPSWARAGAAAVRALNCSLNVLPSRKERLLICANKWDTWALSLHIQCFTRHLRHSLVSLSKVVDFCSLFLSPPHAHIWPSTGHRQVVSSRKKWWYLIVLARTTTLPVLPELNSGSFLRLQCFSSSLRFSSVVSIFSSLGIFHAH